MSKRDKQRMANKQDKQRIANGYVLESSSNLISESLQTDSCPMNDCVPGVEHLQLKGELLIWVGDFDCLKKFVEEGLQQRGKWSSPSGTAKAFKSRDTKLTLTWYHGKNQTLSLQGKDSPVLKAKLINLVRTKDPSSAQFGLRLSVISKSPPSLVEANNSNIYQSRPRGAGGQRNSDHPPNSEIAADLEGIK